MKEAIFVPQHPRQHRRQRDHQTNVPLLRHGSLACAYVAQDLPQLDGNRSRHQRTPLEAGEVEQIVDEPAKPVRVLPGHLQHAGKRLGIRGVAPVDPVETALDSGERRAQFVGNDRDELRLHAFELGNPVEPAAGPHAQRHEHRLAPQGIAVGNRRHDQGPQDRSGRRKGDRHPIFGHDLARAGDRLGRQRCTGVRRSIRSRLGRHARIGIGRGCQALDDLPTTFVGGKENFYAARTQHGKQDPGGLGGAGSQTVTAEERRNRRVGPVHFRHLYEV